MVVPLKMETMILALFAARILCCEKGADVNTSVKGCVPDLFEKIIYSQQNQSLVSHYCKYAAQHIFRVWIEVCFQSC